MTRKEGGRVRHLLLCVALAAGWALAGSACASEPVVTPKSRVVVGSDHVTRTTSATPSSTSHHHKASPVPATQELVSLLQSHNALSRPASGSKSLGLVPAHTPITEERTVLPVLGRRQHWLKVRLPGRPNSHVGWVRTTATKLWSTPWHIALDLSRRKVTVYRAAKRVRSFEAVIGKPSTPTPTGSFFVEESLALQPTDPGAPFALALSARSDVFQEFAGGPGQVAIHGVANIGGVLGTAVSHGCIRLSSEAMRWLVYHVKPGVPVTITR
jgi:lipoprotein-anchoring transpeptidase ErfK/SrfK